MRRKSDTGHGAGVGMASVLVIVMTLALTTFGILSLVSARTQANMSRKLQDTMASYYEAEGRLQEQLADWDAGLASGTEEFTSGTAELAEEVREGQKLVLFVQEGVAGSGERYEISYQRLVNTGEWNPGNKLNVWDGGE